MLHLNPPRQACLSSSAHPAPGEVTALHLSQQMLEQHWANDHKLIQHSQQETIEFGKKSQQQSKSKCIQLGSCVCDSQGPARMMMLQKLTNYLKTVHPGTHKSPSRERTKLLNGLIVIEISEFERDSPEYHQDDSLFLHLGYVNFKMWSKMVALKLSWVHANPFTGWTLLQCDENKLEALSLLQFIKDCLDPTQPSCVTIWNIVDDQKCEVSEDMMYPKFVDVRVDTSLGCHKFWQGSDIEMKRTYRKRKTPDTATTKSRPKQPRPEGPEGSRQAHSEVQDNQDNGNLISEPPEEIEDDMEIADQILQDLLSADIDEDDSDDSDNDNEEDNMDFQDAFKDMKQDLEDHERQQQQGEGEEHGGHDEDEEKKEVDNADDDYIDLDALFPEVQEEPEPSHRGPGTATGADIERISLSLLSRFCFDFGLVVLVW